MVRKTSNLDAIFKMFSVYKLITSVSLEDILQC